MRYVQVDLSVVLNTDSTVEAVNQQVKEWAERSLGYTDVEQIQISVQEVAPSA